MTARPARALIASLLSAVFALTSDALSAPKIEGPFGRGPSQVWIVRPTTTIRLVVVFGHGWKQMQPSPPPAWVRQFEPWIDHLAARGAAIIFPRYQLGGDVPTSTTIADYRAGLKLGFARLGHLSPRVVVMGYSYGASLAFYYAAIAGRWRLPRPAAVDAVFPAGLIGTASLPALPQSTRVLIQVGDQDHEAGIAGAEGFWSWLAVHPRSRKRYEVVRSTPRFLADHAAPKRTTAAARRAFWTPLDRLIAAIGVSESAQQAPAASPSEVAQAQLRGRLPRPLVGRIPVRLATRKRVVALTFDAGANDAGLPRIMSTLRRLGVPGTFFMTGHFARFYPRWARRIAARYPIGNHTMNHLDLRRLPDAEVRAEVVDAGRAIRQITGRAPEPLFRFPYGAGSPRTLRIVNALGYAAVGWTADTAGWLGRSGGQSIAGTVARAVAAVRPGAIILMHVGSNPADGSTLDADALAMIVHRIERRGYTLTTLTKVYAAAYPAWRSRPSPR